MSTSLLASRYIGVSGGLTGGTISKYGYGRSFGTGFGVGFAVGSFFGKFSYTQVIASTQRTAFSFYGACAVGVALLLIYAYFKIQGTSESSPANSIEKDLDKVKEEGAAPFNGSSGSNQIPQQQGQEGGQCVA